ncbi:MAG: hypothetical protein J7L11_05705 [Thermoprotei archaeon]|nr:hypothetical protein [Thermoprotei archaeon]
MSAELKREFLELLEKDKEFRYAVAGYLGLSEIMRKLDLVVERIAKLEEGQKRIWENIERLWEEIKELGRGQERLWKEVRGLSESQRKLWEEVRELRKGQEKLWEEVRELRRGQERLWKEVGKLWEEVRELSESQRRLWEEVRELRKEQGRLWREVRGLRYNFEQLGRAVGMTLDHYTASFLKRYLMDMGYPEPKIEVDVKFRYEGGYLEVNVFCEDPLLVGEVTTYLGTVDEAKSELEKLLERSKIIEGMFKRSVKFKVLAVANVKEGIAQVLRDLAEKNCVLLIVGREVLGS